MNSTRSAWAGVNRKGLIGVTASAALLLAAAAGRAETPAGSVEMPDASFDHAAIFAPLDLPAPNAYRMGDGMPGPDYWQQRADYTIKARLDTAARRLDGLQRIVYHNRSPQPLEFLWLHLEQNIFRPTSRANVYHPGKSAEVEEFPDAGFELRRVALVRGGTAVAAKHIVEDTRMRVDLPAPLASGAQAVIEIDWSFRLPREGLERMGVLETAAGEVFALAQWYPRMAVFDDIRGWNTLPYGPTNNFYLGFGDFDVELTVPRELIVWSTGDLLNPEEVLTAEHRARLERARGSAQRVYVVAPEEVGRPANRPAGTAAELTWKFRASNMRDFVWAASDALIWDAAGWNGVLVNSAYPREGVGTAEAPGYETATELSREVMQSLSTLGMRYPYETLTHVVTPADMEYPVVVFHRPEHRGAVHDFLVVHALQHMLFPMLVGTDESRYYWFDEGLTIFTDYLFFFESGRPVRAGDAGNKTVHGDHWQVMRDRKLFAERMREPAMRQPIVTRSDLIGGEHYHDAKYFTNYQKFPYALVLLRNDVLGPERFDPAFRTFIDRWSGRHPTPWDFFRAMSSIGGEDLDWFWRGWLFTGALLDFAVADVSRDKDGTRIALERHEEQVMPIVLRVSFADGSSTDIRLPVEFWYTGRRNEFLVRDVREVTRVQIDPDHVLPDTQLDDNVWTAAPR